MEIFVSSRKPSSAYVLSVWNALNNGGTVSIRARGRAIANGVTVVERVKKLFPAVKVNNISIGSDELTKDGKTVKKVSYININLNLSR